MTFEYTLRKLKNAFLAVVIALRQGYVWKSPFAFGATQKPKAIYDFKPEKPDDFESGFEPLAFAIHIHYPDQVDKFINYILKHASECHFYITVNQDGTFRKIESALKNTGVTYTLRITPNIGRNFAPFLVEFRNELLKYSGFVHVHSKKSAHSKTGFGEAWAERSLALLLDPSNERKLRHLIQNQPEVGLVFAEARDLFRRINFYWGASAYPLLRSPKLKFLASRLDRRSELLFPIGGMFWARTEAVMELLQVNWEYNDFPTENGQLDGQLQHSLERAFGEVAINAGFRLAIFDQNRQRFEIY